MKKKIIALLLAAAMCAGALAGCGSEKADSGPDNSGKSDVESNSDTKEEQPSSTDGEDGEAGDGTVQFPLKEPMTFTAFAGINGEVALEDTVSLKKALENTNIEFDFTNVLTADLEEKKNLLLNSGGYPDLFIKANIDGEKFGLQGVLIPLEDLIREYAPNLTALLDERDGWQYITASDGHVYALPQIGNQGAADPKFWINKRWMDNLGLSEPTNFEELYQVLKAFKEQDANGNGDPDDEIPLFCDTFCTPFLLLGYEEDYTYSNANLLAVIDGELTYLPTHESYKEMLVYLTKLYSEGLLDKNSFTQGHEQAAAIGSSGDVLGAFFDAGAFLTVGRERDMDYIALTPFADTLPLSSGMNPNTMAITDKCQHPEVLIAWVDRFYTEEGGKLAFMGVEGETYEYNDDGTWGWLLGNGYGDDISTVRTYNFTGGYVSPQLMPKAWADMSPDIDPNEAYLGEQSRKLAAHGRVALPVMHCTEDEAAELATLTADLNSYLVQYRAQVIIGELDLEESWDNYVATLNQMGLERLMEIHTRSYEDAVKK